MSKKVDGLWFSDDALVVLRAGESIFRLPKSILAARSPVFQAMLEFPQPTASVRDSMMDADEMIDGSPVVCMPDSATDLEPFLRAIFDSSYFMPPTAKFDFHALLGILRLSHKYDVGYLYKRAVCHMETIYPIEMDRIEGIRSNNLDYHQEIGLTLTAIPVLHEVGATWLLPYAYYNVAEFPSGALISAGEPWDKCGADMKQTCFLLLPVQIRATERLSHALTTPSTCASSDTCDLLKFRFLRTRDGLHQCPLSEFLFSGWKEFENELCPDCATQAHTQYNSVRAKIWEELPANCGLEKWEVLLERRRAALE
ncbi:hypothetical protein DFH08DRAFT_1036300 [Mycena albidolilacea]|uniref:BTB domain-containing protein n=1 Tax=Mycena albidolilacea TaxID=1033008 RepID=A0AAD6ZDQ6_9AGAR|nr:hypothetical protein DFH08DRAFT_1036300 [Mycena albidolilacea]